MTRTRTTSLASIAAAAIRLNPGVSLKGMRGW
jgi:hypothetical protein